MTSKERVLMAMAHQEPDRVPLNIWLYRPDVNELVVQRYGSVDNLFDLLQIDMFTTFPPGPKVISKTENGRVTMEDLPDLKFNDPRESALYDGCRAQVQKYGVEKQRAVFCQTVGVFEASDSLFGIENHLMYMALYPEEMMGVYRKLTDWYCAYVEEVIKAGVDVVHISDDWGQNYRMLFSPKTWWEMIYPFDKEIVQTARSRDIPVSLHSDGYIYDVLDGVVEMGIQAAHPVQASAGMDPNKVKAEYGDKLTLYGTLDIHHVLPRGTDEEIVEHVADRMANLKPGGGFIFCSDHTIQPDTTLDRVELAYKTALEHSWY